MRRLIPSAAIAVSAILNIGAASAADLPVKAPAYKAPIADAWNWTGFYLGANVGGGWTRNSADFVPDVESGLFFQPGPAGLLPRSASFNSSGVIGGVQLGYNWQFDPRWLFGVETDFNGSGVKGSATNSGSTIGFPIAETVDERIKLLGTLRARLGFLPVNNFLAYLTGGLAYARVDHTGILSNIGPAGLELTGTTSFACNGNATCFAGSASDTATGWTLGGGLEYALWKNVTVKAEYLYISLGGGSLTETAVLLPNGATVPSTINMTYGRTRLNVARLGLNWHF